MGCCIEQAAGYRPDMKMRMPRTTDSDDVSVLFIGKTLQLDNGVARAMVKAGATDTGHLERVREFAVECRCVCLEIDWDQADWVGDD